MMLVLFSRSSVKHWNSDLAVPFALWSLRPEKICYHCKSGCLLQCGVARFWQLKAALLPLFINHCEPLLPIPRVCSAVKGSWSGDVVVKRFVGPNTLLCVCRGWHDSREEGKQGVTREVYGHPVGFFVRVLPGVPSNHRSGCSGMQCTPSRSYSDLIDPPVEP